MVDNAHEQTPQTWFVATDGSEASDAAFEVAYKGLYRKDTDHFVVGHVSDRRKDYLPFNLRPEYLSEIYLSKIALAWAEKKGEYVNSEIDPSKSTKECVWELAKEKHATIIVTGMHGRKGLKADETVAGTAVQYLSLNSTLPIMIVKDPRMRSEKKNHAYKYAVLYDQSKQSKKVLDIVLKLMTPQDEMWIITCKEPKINVEGIHEEVTE